MIFLMCLYLNIIMRYYNDTFSQSPCQLELNTKPNITECSKTERVRVLHSKSHRSFCLFIIKKIINLLRNKLRLLVAKCNGQCRLKGLLFNMSFFCKLLILGHGAENCGEPAFILHSDQQTYK